MPDEKVTFSTGEHPYVQFGCGYHAPQDWVNFDASITLRAERIPFLGKFVQKNATRFPENAIYGDIVRGLPIPDGICAGVFACHVLEHLTLHEARRALQNTYRLLMPDGILRIVVPDLLGAADRYLASRSPEAAHEFMRTTLLGREEAPNGWVGHLTRAFGRSAHLWMWDRNSLSYELAQVGFRKIRPCYFNDSPDTMFRLVEESHRFNDATALECVK